ncbi:20S proteasome alpha subunit G [Dorcoceras hygrometricum]|uniref:20S proteasome alpha subunit G n=1 Tax=Dorcoceras hygrometricum TaxID=472368 RepID=A0A2Z7CEW9_9LAMI|nr:20S proteasome alpha subunit G [Dorcoceras hygrometricum]
MLPRWHLCLAPTGITIIRLFSVDCGSLRQSGPRPDPRLLRQAALEALTRSARTNTPRKTRPEQIPAKWRRRRAVHGGGVIERGRRQFWDTASRGPTTIVAPESQFRTCPTDHGITDSACKNQSVVVSVQYGPFNPYIPIRSTTIGKSRVAIDPIAMHTSWRSNSDIASAASIGYPRMSASGESSTTMHRLLHASRSHPIPTPYDSSLKTMVPEKAGNEAPQTAQEKHSLILPLKEDLALPASENALLSVQLLVEPELAIQETLLHVYRSVHGISIDGRGTCYHQWEETTSDPLRTYCALSSLGQQCEEHRREGKNCLRCTPNERQHGTLPRDHHTHLSQCSRSTPPPMLRMFPQLEHHKTQYPLLILLHTVQQTHHELKPFLGYKSTLNTSEGRRIHPLEPSQNKLYMIYPSSQTPPQPLNASHDDAKEYSAEQHPHHYPKHLAHLQPAYQVYLYLSSTASKRHIKGKHKRQVIK